MVTKSLYQRQAIQNQSGFTLIELLIVVIVLGILALIIIPQVTVSTEDARQNALRTDLSHMRSIIEVYYTQHRNNYPGDSVPATKPVDVVTINDAFIAQLTRYTDLNGNISNTGDATYRYGPYIKAGTLPTNPYNDLNTVTVDNATADITSRTSDGTTGWKFYSMTGVLMANDGGHDTW